MANSFFGVQLVLANVEELRSRLHGLVVGSREEMSFAEQRTLFERIGRVLTEFLPSAGLGYWDYLVDDAEARGEFESWCSEIEGDAEEENEARGVGTDGRCIVTVAFLLLRGGASDKTVADRCDVPEEEYWTRKTFGRLLMTLPQLSFPSVKSHSVYMVPGKGGAWVAPAELAGEGYEYLREIT